MSIVSTPIEPVAADFLKEEFFSKAQSTTIADFLDKYSLHDSHWIDVHLDPIGQSIVALIAWDTFWSRERIQYPPMQYLFIVFEDVYQILFGKNHTEGSTADIISGAGTHLIPKEEQEKLLSLGTGLGIDDPHTTAFIG